MSKFRIIVLSFVIGMLTPTCTVNEQNNGVYNQKNYQRITTDLDSSNKMYVVYQSLLDTNRAMIKYYWDNGKLQAISFFLNHKKDGHWVQYFDNGVLSYQGNFLNDVMVDTQKIYFPSGKLSLFEVYNNGNKVGTWHYFNENGTLERIETYSK